MSKTVKIPECMNPFEVIVNGKHYSYPAGTTQEVPDDVAAVIEAHEQAHEEQPAPPPPTDGGILNEDGKINPSFLPNHRFEMGMPLNYFVNPKGAAGDGLMVFPLNRELAQVILSAKENHHPINLVFDGGDSSYEEIVCEAKYFAASGALLSFYVIQPDDSFTIEVDLLNETIVARSYY